MELSRNCLEDAGTGRPILYELMINESATLNAELERRRAKDSKAPRQSFSHTRPCYFNTGCCAFKDGDITGIEVTDGQIKLVRWPAAAGDAGPVILEQAPLQSVFDAVNRQ